MRKGRLDEQPCHETQCAGLLRLLGFDRERLAQQLVGLTLARDRSLRDSENGCSQSLEGGQLGEERVRSWHQTGYQILHLEH
mgnify:CR=1 FL=1